MTLIVAYAVLVPFSGFLSFYHTADNHCIISAGSRPLFGVSIFLRLHHMSPVIASCSRPPFGVSIFLLGGGLSKNAWGGVVLVPFSGFLSFYPPVNAFRLPVTFSSPFRGFYLSTILSQL